MKSKEWIKKALSTCLMIVTIAAYSMVALANTGEIAGELLITGTNDAGVTVNGETAKNGRSIASSSTIVTPKNTGAIINIGKIGSIKLAPKTTLNLTFSEKGINGNLLAGEVTVLNAADNVNIVTNGKLTKLVAGETAVATKAQDEDDDDDPGTGAWFIWALVLGGAAAGLIIAATNDNDLQVGGGSVVVSPNR